MQISQTETLKEAAMGIDRVSDLTEQQCREIAGMAETNHIWINAFKLINPSDDFLLDVGRMVVSMLKQKDNLIPARADHDDKLARLTPKLYLSVNQS